MSERRSPQQKKEDSYRHDWRARSRIEQSALRVGRRRRKAGINRANRRIALAAFLTALVAVRGDEARHLAAVWQERLEDRFRARPWLESFFRDEPALRDTLYSWIARWGARVEVPVVDDRSHPGASNTSTSVRLSQSS